MDKSQANKMGLLTTFIFKFISIIIFISLFLIAPNKASGQSQRHWIYFRDKTGIQSVEISSKALTRRNMRGSGHLQNDYDNLPDSTYILSLKKVGLTVHVVSRWLNAVSVSGPEEILQAVKDFNFVKQITPVATFSRERIETAEVIPAPAESLSPQCYATIDYGPSFTQLHLCQIDSLQSLGYTGDGVLIGIMDTGFKLDHPSLEHLSQEGHIIATHDFINGDNNVQDSVNIQQWHGTAVLSAIGAYREDTLIGSAYEADFILAKTEIQNEEIPAEEDYWIEAIEWMEPEGVDIVSSSLGYIDWYTQSQLDGHTAAITIAAEVAASLGVIVVNSAGNERGNAWGTIIPPADGDSVIAAGGVTAEGSLWSGSSPGPTADGRIKPDVCAMAEDVIAAFYYTDSYSRFTGTSMAAPIVAGGVALVLEAHPDWSVGDVLRNIRLSASRAQYPDNDYGWGIAQFQNMYSGGTGASQNVRFIVAPNPARGSVNFRFRPPLTDESDVIVFSMAGDRIIDLHISPPAESLDNFVWDATNSSGKAIASGIYIAYLKNHDGRFAMKFAYVKD